MFKQLKALFLFCIFSGTIYLAVDAFQETSKNEEIANRDKQLLYDLTFKNLFIEREPPLDQIDAHTLEIGKTEAKKHKIVIAGITRDNANDLLTITKSIENIGESFADYQVIVFENDSADGFKQALRKWSELNEKVHIISKDFNIEKRPSHKFMAEIRNIVLNEYKRDKFKDFDLLLVLDFDMSYGVDIRGIYDSLAKIKDWDSICANGIANANGKMYDAFAFRSEKFPFSPNEWQELCLNNDKRCDYPTNILKDIFSFRSGWQEKDRLYWLKIIPQIQTSYIVNSALVPVNSCFGGLAIYKREITQNCIYDSLDNDCEHVHFHNCIKQSNRARMFLNPNMMIRYSHYRE